MPLLEVSGLTKSYYGVTALNSVDFDVEPGEIVGLIGPNGSGKTTAIDCISGFLQADGGEVRFAGKPVGSFPHRLARKGLVRTFQTVRIFATMTVRENVAVAGAAVGTADPAVVEAVLEELRLTPFAETRAEHLSYGQRKLVELATALVMSPTLLLLDEPIAAINPTLGQAIMSRIRGMNERGIAILLVEHNIEAVLSMAHRLVVLDQGNKIADGSPHDVIGLPAVQEAYFGR